MSQRTLFQQKKPGTNDPIQHEDPNDLVSLYKRSNDVRRQQILDQLNADEIKALYEFYLDEFKDLITVLKNQNNFAHVEARAMYDMIISVKEQKNTDLSSFHITHHELFDALHRSADLIRTVNSDNTLSAEFPARSQKYYQTTTALRQNAGAHRFAGVMEALSAAVSIAGMIAVAAVSILTYGATLPLFLFWGGGLLASGVLATPFILSAHSHFKQAREETRLANRIDALDTAIKSNVPGIN